MPERLSDERLRHLRDHALGEASLSPRPRTKYIDTAAAIDELLDLRAKAEELNAAASNAIGEALTLRAQLSAGPVMPETPSLDAKLAAGKVFVTVFGGGDDRQMESGRGYVTHDGCGRIVDAIRNALAAEQNGGRP